MAGNDSPGTGVDGNNAWPPLVLSLDGGGVRGLSSLYILREIMKAIKSLDERDRDEMNRTEQQGQALPKPCDYFDFIIGTSTGGLIAIMLGRLRMGVEECIKQYWIMTNQIFRPQRTRYIQLYSRRKVQDAAKEVVRQYCQCHRGQPDGCAGEENLRQYDYTEEGELQTKTCRVAVVALKEGGRNTFSRQSVDVPILFRSYDHRRRTDTSWTSDAVYELNPKLLDNADLKIDEACSCTSAAPTYFKSVQLKGRKYIDGGVTANNPAVIAWNEATLMANPPKKPWAPIVFPKVLISIGTGKAKAHSRFGTVSLVMWIFKHITDTTTAHHTAHALVNQARSSYFRFNVPEKSRNSNHEGLSHIGMDECKKTRKKTKAEEEREQSSVSTSGSQSQADDHQQEADHGPEAGLDRPRRETTRDVINRFKSDDKPLQAQATETGKKGGYKPNKYDYQTFDNIRDRTAAYCNSDDEQGQRVQDLIERSAYLLWSQNKERKKSSLDRWVQFSRHPDPKYFV